MGTGFLFALDLDLFFVEVDNNFILFVLSEPFKVFFEPFGTFVNTQDASEGSFEESLIEDDTDGGMGVPEWEWEYNNIEEDNKGEYVPVFGNKNECFLHDHVAKDIKQWVLIEHFEYLESPVSNDLINKVVLFEIKFHGDFIDRKLVKFIDVRLDLKFMLKEVVELEFELLNEVEDIDLFEIGAVGVLVHALELDWVEYLNQDVFEKTDEGEVRHDAQRKVATENLLLWWDLFLACCELFWPLFCELALYIPVVLLRQFTR